MNKRLYVAALTVAALYGCGSQPTQEEPKAGVEERTPAARPATPAPTLPPTVSKPAPQPVVQYNPLKDPKNILYKRSVYYDYNKDDIKEEYRPMLQAHARYLSENASAKMLIQGNCDERGSREYNIALGQRRADGLRRLLVLLGAREAQIESVSLGEEKPRCTEQNDACYSQNRRGDILYGGEY